MKALLELHYLQNFAPSNLNRDDTGSPKDAYFGGTRRARVSSQSFKRAMRMDFRERGTVTPAELGERTKRAHEAVRDRLVAAGKPAAEAEQAAVEALRAVKLDVKVSKRKDGTEEKKSEYLLFLGRDELQRFSDLILQHWDELALHLQKLEEESKKAKPRPVELDKKFRAVFLGALDGSRAVDVALFGRMLADLPDKNADAAAQVAHALSTHAMRGREFDFYTAVDDLKPGDTAGADMLGTVEFGSATYYRYACVDLQKLLQNLGGDLDLAVRGLRAFLEASVYAAPTGKQNTFAAHNAPSLMVQVVREDTSPRNLANAFERAVRERGEGFVRPSMEALAAEMKRQDAVFGGAGRVRYVNAVDGQEVADLEGRLDSVQALIDATVADAEGLLRGLKVSGALG
ncbi:type I-E CRISPR-associated protein Cas7/Cse4/CasC [Deinococcus metallilatus]|uniref:CRISPR system Cascade subunit CasC n=1 Tax=Deinococcus metallilatus TaxID=1211322 RepID=A0AAJ5F9I3_9DEIO|nr:type I-E CRISPR-associated protein Cas7/Cse4/CasC [Deinococcus metallilatus]MBB5294932.1 CRISPR system Cascade subunit CasC [Deinococcus metallilatus]QBY09363.1 type I-E CRISPR-associated protein Cas7/Cse4/CasC [Deinococcus metallilatus]RXJ09368.1 type I-E CRISPR-associated protein Cas7/Cse4/CasC [Deinococcus metallilatus]TLK28890.1 type I-E CRISPR-associated protein Cas7/Cse4/CasC [Deinococcus metallilatus]GMA16862.1 type I-E CRISPR-associated protein Cas7/Cse4/CasC [Deinococcus metallilat